MLGFKVRVVVCQLLIFLLSACSVVPVEKDVNYSRSAMLPLYNLKHWSFDGRMVLTGQNDSRTVNINWEHSPDAEKIKLSGLWGQGAVFILLAGNVITIDRGAGDVQSSTQLEAFINQQLGMFIPVRSLRYWVVGLPEPFGSFKDTDFGFNQAGWLSEYKQMQSINMTIMPRKLMVMNNQVKLKLVIDHWVLQ